MTMVMIEKHRILNVSRRSLCDNCELILCDRRGNGRITKCSQYRPVFVAFKKCTRCGSIFEVFSSITSLDYDLCPECNRGSGSSGRGGSN